MAIRTLLWTGVPKNQPITAAYLKDKKYDRAR